MASTQKNLGLTNTQSAFADILYSPMGEARYVIFTVLYLRSGQDLDLVSHISLIAGILDNNDE